MSETVEMETLNSARLYIFDRIEFKIYSFIAVDLDDEDLEDNKKNLSDEDF